MVFMVFILLAVNGEKKKKESKLSLKSYIKNKRGKNKV